MTHEMALLCGWSCAQATPLRKATLGRCCSLSVHLEAGKLSSFSQEGAPSGIWRALWPLSHLRASGRRLSPLVVIIHYKFSNKPESATWKAHPETCVHTKRDLEMWNKWSILSRRVRLTRPHGHTVLAHQAPLSICIPQIIRKISN